MITEDEILLLTGLLIFGSLVVGFMRENRYDKEAVEKYYETSVLPKLKAEAKMVELMGRIISLQLFILEKNLEELEKNKDAK